MLMRGKIKRPGGGDMKFRTRITLVYAALALAVSLGLGVFYNNYMVQRYETSVHNRFSILSEQMLNNLDSELQKMTQVTLSLLSDQDAVQTIRELSVEMEDPDANIVNISRGKDLIRDTIYTAYNLDNFYRVVVFNRYGYIAASATMQERFVDTEKDVSEIPWLDDVKGTKGKGILIGLHLDDWAEAGTTQQAFSLVREIQGNHLGFIEVQQSEAYLRDIFAVPDDGMKVIAVKANGEVIYATDGTDPEQYRGLFQKSPQITEEKNSVTGQAEFISIGELEEFGVRLLMIQERDDAMADMPTPGLRQQGWPCWYFFPRWPS